MQIKIDLKVFILAIILLLVKNIKIYVNAKDFEIEESSSIYRPAIFFDWI